MSTERRRAGLTRRLVLQGAVASLAMRWGGSAAVAAEGGARKLVVVVLRGGLDGLAAVVPWKDPALRGLRGRLALPEPGSANGVLPIAEGFALHPRLTHLHGRWAAGELAVLHAASSPYRDRSHFDAQDVLESGGARVFDAEDGWLNRALALRGRLAAGGVAIGPTVPLLLRGSAPVTSWAPSGAPDPDEDTLARLADLYAGDPSLAADLAQAVATDALLGDGATTGMGMARGGPGGLGAWARLFEAAATLLGTAGGPDAAVVGLDGWDTHANQGAVDGALAARLAALDAGLAALHTRLGALWSSTAVIVVSEFGRTAAANGTGGTDHGTGGVALLLGGAVQGGRMLGDWPGLAPGALHEGRDLAPANDLRALFAGVLHEHWGVERADLAGRVFPGSGGVRRLDGLIRG